MDAGLMRLDKTSNDISKTVEEAVADAGLTAPSAQITLHLGSGLPMVDIDARRIRQVLDNLIDNAIKYSDGTSNIVVTVKKDGSELCISVADKGVGIPPDDLGRIFDRMYRAEQRLSHGSKGLGLGLSVCKGMVEAHGGRIWVDSVVGAGSTFHFTFPLTNDGEEERSDNGHSDN
jgi:two-component system sensor histidine kinase KdpD